MKNDLANKVVIAVDLGATNIRAARIINGKIIDKYTSALPSDKDKNAESVINSVIEAIEHVFSDEAEGIGVGVPSVVDRKNGIIYDVQNIPSWKEVPLKYILEDKFSRSVFINNDANCFAIGEKVYGKGRQYSSFVGLAIGTGIGGGIVNNNSLLKDVNCGAGEFGEMKYLDARYEDYCSGIFFKNRYKTDGKELYKKAKTNDRQALDIFNEFGKHLGNLIKAIILAVDPEAFIIGGAVASSHEFFEKSMWDEIKEFPYPMSLKSLKIEYAELGEDAQLFGAAAMFLDAVK